MWAGPAGCHDFVHSEHNSTGFPQSGKHITVVTVSRKFCQQCVEWDIKLYTLTNSTTDDMSGYASLIWVIGKYCNSESDTPSVYSKIPFKII